MVAMQQPVRGVDTARPYAGWGWCATAAIVVVIARWWTSRGRVVFHITPDEPGQLAISRFVAGTARWNMNDHSTWRPAYGTLIAPIHWFTDDPPTMFTAALWVNAMLGGVAAALLYVLARRLTDLPPIGCALGALAVSLAPATLFTTNWVWAEALVSVVFLGVVLALLRFWESPTPGAGVLVASLAIAGYATHSRLLPLALVAAGVFVFAAAAGRLAVRSAAGLVALLVVLFAGVSWCSELLVDRIWEQPHSTNSYGGVLGQATRLGPTAISAVGQSWYQLVTTAGVVGIGLVATVRAAWLTRGRAVGDVEVGDEPDRSAPVRSDGPSRDDARVLLATVGSLVALSMLFMADRWRPDQLVYGRYNDAVVTPLLLIGLAALARWPARAIVVTYAALAAVVAGCWAVLAVFRAEELRSESSVLSMILGLRPFIGRTAAVPIGRATVIALGVLAVVAVAAVLARRKPGAAALVAVVGVLVVVGDATARPIVDASKNGWEGASAVRQVDDGLLAAGAPVRFRLVHDSQRPRASWSLQRQRAMLYQFYLPDHAFYYDNATPPRDRVEHVFAPLNDPALLGAGAVVVWRDPAVPMGLWYDPAITLEGATPETP